MLLYFLFWIRLWLIRFRTRHRHLCRHYRRLPHRSQSRYQPRQSQLRLNQSTHQRQHLQILISKTAPRRHTTKQGLPFMLPLMHRLLNHQHRI